MGKNEIRQWDQAKQDRYWMEQALRLAAQAADLGEVPVGALVVCDGESIAQAFNQPIHSHDPCAHAEIVALRRAGEALGNYRLANCSLYVSLEPCSMCAGAIVHARIERLVYGASEPKAGVIESRARFLEEGYLNYQVEWLGGVMAEESSELLSSFFRRRRQEKKQARQAENKQVEDDSSGASES